MKSKIIIFIIVLLVIFQFFGEKTPYQEPTSADLFAVENAPEEVKLLIQKNCYDCHSNQVNYPWYSNVAPVSWWLQSHIDEAREHLNFSNWADYKADKKAHKMEEAWEEVEEEEMPLPSYTYVHWEANLSEAEKEILIDWFKEIEGKYKKSS
ncbi:MAG: cytochrome C [Flavobacteriales bacterium]|nr:cytochrome C [Flavobacteriales bacterium]|tara:strand:+ start:30650 stop:31105 length:456 start_codon:yes stop_codon:yes gene_type:complete